MRGVGGAAAREINKIPTGIPLLQVSILMLVGMRSGRCRPPVFRYSGCPIRLSGIGPPDRYLTAVTLCANSDAVTPMTKIELCWVVMKAPPMGPVVLLVTV